MSSVTSAAAAAGPAPCRRFLAGKCDRKDCKYPHVPAVAAAAAPAAAAAGSESTKSAESKPKEERSSTPCRTYVSTGACSRGTKCKFSHDPTLKDALKLDVRVPEEFLTQLNEHSVKVLNGEFIKPHPRSRAARSLAERLLARIAGESRVLYMQHRRRSELVYATCRWKIDDNDEEFLCNNRSGDGPCLHEVGLQAGDYDTICLLDCPSSPDDVNTMFLTWPAVKSVYMAVHNYTSRVGSVLDQDFMWSERGGTAGSIGSYIVSTPGSETLTEPDQFWLTTSQAAELKIEAVCNPPGYRIFRITRRPGREVPRYCVNAMDMMSQHAAPGSYTFADGVMHRYSSQFGVFVQGQQVYPVNLTELRTVFDRADGRDTTTTLAARIAGVVQNMPRKTSDTASLTHVAFVLKHQTELPALRAAYAPPGDAPWWQPVWWRDTRRAIFARANAMRLGTWQAPRRALVWFTTFLLSVVLAVVGLPASWFTRATICMVDVASSYGTRYGEGQPAICHEPDPYLHGSVSAGYRAAMALFAMLFLSKAFGAAATTLPTTTDVRLAYITDPYAAIVYDGPLGDHGKPFGLPSLIMDCALKPIAQDCSVTVLPTTDTGDAERDGLFGVGITFGSHVPTVCRPCQQNETIAVTNRQCVATPPWTWDVAETNLNITRLVTLFEERYDQAPFRRDFVQWNLRFPEAKRDAHTQIYNAYQAGSPIDLRVLSVVKAFLKVEKKNQHHGGPYDPRVISGRPDEFKVLFGPFVEAMARVIKPSFSHVIGAAPAPVVFAAGHDSATLGDWIEQVVQQPAGTHWVLVCGDDQLIVVIDDDGNVLLLELDGSRHDSLMHEVFLDAKWRFYAAVLQLSNGYDDDGFVVSSADVLAAAKAATQMRVGRMPHGVRYKHPFRVCSGDDDTYLGNCIDTALVADAVVRFFTTARRSGLALAEAMEFAIGQLKDLVAYNAKGKIHTEFCNATFLSGCFVPTLEGKRWAPLPGRLLTRLGWVTTLRSKPGLFWRDLAGTINGFKDYLWMPFVRVYLRAVMSLVPEAYRHFERDDYHHVVGSHATIDDSTWSHFLARYGLSQADEQRFTVECARATQLPYMIDSEILTILAAVDL